MQSPLSLSAWDVTVTVCLIVTTIQRLASTVSPTKHDNVQCGRYTRDPRAERSATV